MDNYSDPYPETPLIRKTANRKKDALSRKSPLNGIGRYAVVAITIILGLIYLNIPKYVHVLNENFLAKYFYYAFFAMVLPLLFLKNKALMVYLRTPFFVWVLALAVLNFIHLWIAQVGGSGARVDLIGTRIQYICLAALLGFAFSITRTETYERIFLVLAILIPCLMLLDFLNPEVLCPHRTTYIGRAFATFLNPNIAGSALLITMLLAMSIVRSGYRLPFLLIGGAGLFPTFSRGPIITWGLLWLFLVIRKAVPRMTLIIPITAFFVLPLIIQSFGDYVREREDIGSQTQNITARLEFFQTRSLDDNSAQERMEVLREGWDLFLKDPVFGAGAGATSAWSLRASTHNQFVLLAAEYGIFGILLWIWLAIVLWRGKYFRERLFQLAMVFTFVLQSIFTHNMFDDLIWLTTFALISGWRRNR